MTPTRGPKIATRGAEKTKRRFGQISRFRISAIFRFSCTVEKAARPGKSMRQFLYVRFYVYLRVLYLHTYLRTYLHVFTCIYVRTYVYLCTFLHVFTCIYIRIYKAELARINLRRCVGFAIFMSFYVFVIFTVFVIFAPQAKKFARIPTRKYRISRKYKA